MASVKFSGLPAGSTPTDYNGLVAISTVGAPFDSEKYTLTQLQAIMLTDPSDRQITVNSTSTDKILSDSNTSSALFFGASGSLLSESDNFVASYAATLGDGSAGSYAETALNFGNSSYTSFSARNDSANFPSIAEVYVGDTQILRSIKGVGSGWSVNATPTFPVVIGSSSSGVALADLAVRDSVAIGGSGLSINKSNYAFTENLEVQGGTLDLVQATENTSFIDAGSVSATEQDWIEVTVGGNTGYIRVYATK